MHLIIVLSPPQPSQGSHQQQPLAICIPVITDTWRRWRQTSANSQQSPNNSASDNPDFTIAISSASSFGAGLPPVPNRLVKQIQDGEFVDVSKLTN